MFISKTKDKRVHISKAKKNYIIALYVIELQIRDGKLI